MISINVASASECRGECVYPLKELLDHGVSLEGSISEVVQLIDGKEGVIDQNNPNYQKEELC